MQNIIHFIFFINILQNDKALSFLTKAAYMRKQMASERAEVSDFMLKNIHTKHTLQTESLRLVISKKLFTWKTELCAGLIRRWGR